MNLHDIASHLPGTWVVGDNESDVERFDGLKLWFREGGYGNNGRISISFSRPCDARGQYMTLWGMAGDKVSDPRITVSADKSPELIAKDIVRRLLPDAEKVFALALDRNRQEDNFHTGKIKTIFRIATACNTEPERHYQTKELTGEIDPYKGAGCPAFKSHGYGKIKVSGEECVTIELTSVGVETAVEIVSAINKILNKKATNE